VAALPRLGEVFGQLTQVLSAGCGRAIQLLQLLLLLLLPHVQAIAAHCRVRSNAVCRFIKLPTETIF